MIISKTLFAAMHTLCPSRVIASHGRYSRNVSLSLSAQPVDATQALNLSAGVSNEAQQNKPVIRRAI